MKELGKLKNINLKHHSEQLHWLRTVLSSAQGSTWDFTISLICVQHLKCFP